MVNLFNETPRFLFLFRFVCHSSVMGCRFTFFILFKNVCRFSPPYSPIYELVNHRLLTIENKIGNYSYTSLHIILLLQNITSHPFLIVINILHTKKSNKCYYNKRCHIRWLFKGRHVYKGGEANFILTAIYVIKFFCNKHTVVSK